MRYSPFELPEQNIPDSKKNDKWHVAHAQKMLHYIINSDYSGRLGQIRQNENRYMAQTVKRDTVTAPNTFDLGQEYETYPLIEGIIDDIIGKYLSRPLKRKTYSINRDAVNSILDTKMDYIIEEIFRSVNKELQNEANVELSTPNPDIKLPEDVEEFFSKSYKTVAEEVSDDLITQFLDVNGFKDRIKYILTEYLYGDTCACYLDEKDGHPELVRVRYDECYFDINPDSEVQKDMEVFAFFKFYTENEIYNQFPHLNRTDKQKVKEAFIRMNSGMNFNEDEPTLGVDYDNMFQNSKKGVSYKGWYDQTERRHRLRVLVMKWKSRREIRRLEFEDKKTGKTNYKLLPSEYKARNRDIVESTSVETVHFVKMLGPEVLLDYGEVEERNGKIDNPAKATIPALALVGKTYIKSGEIRSIASKLAGLQVFASDILFQMKYAINSMDGKVMIYDAAQTPKQFIDTYGPQNAINRVLHHMKKDKFVVINSADKKDRHTFNQFTTMDLSNRGLIKDLMDALMLVEDLSRKFVGLTKEAQEGGDKYQTATGINRSIIASNSRIEVYFEPFDSFMGELLNKYLQKAKVVYPKGKVFSQIFGDMQTKFYTIHKNFFDVDLGVYIGDSSKDLRDKQIIDRGAEQALSNSQDPRVILDLINVLEKDNASESKAILERSVNALEKLTEQNNKAAQAQFEQEQANKKAIEDEKNALTREGYEKDIKVANIYANNKADVEARNRTSEELKTAAKLETDLIKEEIKGNKKETSPKSE